MDVAWSQNDPARYRALAAELAAKKPVLLVVFRDTEAKIVLPLVGSIPILFAAGFDPIGLGLLKSLASPGGTVTGISIQLRELTAKRLGILKDTLPQLKRAGVLYRTGDANSQHWLDLSIDEGRARGIQLIPAPIERREDFIPAFKSMAE